MKKRKNTMLTLLGMLLVLVLCYFLIEKVQENKTEESDADETIYVTEMSELVSVEYSDGTSSMSFVKKEDVWYYEANETIALTQSSIESMVLTFGYITATREIGEPDALADYGLEDPSYTIVLKDASDNATTIYIGGEIDGYYYLTIEDKEVVYTVDSSVVSAMEFDIETLKEVEETEESE